MLPYRRTKVKRELRDRINILRDQLNTAMKRQFETELANSMQRIREAIAPYTRFVRVEREKLDRLDQELRTAKREVHSIRDAVYKQESAPAVDPV
ncbi:MAG: hypothetical protein HC802_02385 [Caldilineaceae bacterium]|nr:hypothetical protein [Caldilineaceae bacterium]